MYRERLKSKHEDLPTFLVYYACELFSGCVVPKSHDHGEVYEEEVRLNSLSLFVNHYSVETRDRSTSAKY